MPDCQRYDRNLREIWVVFCKTWLAHWCYVMVETKRLEPKWWYILAHSDSDVVHIFFLLATFFSRFWASNFRKTKQLASKFSEIFDITWIFNNEMKALALKSHLNMYLHGGYPQFRSHLPWKTYQQKRMCTMFSIFIISNVMPWVCCGLSLLPNGCFMGMNVIKRDWKLQNI